MKTATKAICLILLLLQFTGCVTRSTVEFYSNEDNIDVLIDGKARGNVPFELEMSNGIWNDPHILVRKEGFYDYRYRLEREIKPFNLVMGFFIFWPWLWCYGPAEYQYIDLYPLATD